MHKVCKVCTIDGKDAQTLCPDPRLFEGCVREMMSANTPKQFDEIKQKWNAFCEAENCPYLKDSKKTTRTKKKVLKEALNENLCETCIDRQKHGNEDTFKESYCEECPMRLTP